MARKTNHISILQFDERLLSLLRVRRSARGVDVLDAQVERGNWSASDGSLAAALKEFARRHGVANDTICTVLPRHDMTARMITLPSQSEEEVAGMVRLAAMEHVPYPPEELVIDQCVIQRLSDGQARVFAVFAHRDIVEAHVRLLHAAGLDPERMFVSSACLASAAIEALKGNEERIALVDLASGGIEMLALNGFRVEYSRAVAATYDWSLTGPDAANAAEELGTEVRASLGAYRRESEDGLGVDRLYVCSDWADVTAACETLEAVTGCECGPARFAHSLATKGADHVAALPLVALGAALAAQERAAVTISLVPESLQRERRRTGVRRDLIKAGSLAAAIVLSLAILFAQAVYQRKAYLGELEKRMAEVRPIAENVQRQKEQLNRLQQHVDRTGTAVQLLGQLCDLMPGGGINITHLSFVHGKSLKFEGRAESEGDVILLSEALRDAGVPQFSRARAGRSQTEMERGVEVVRYNMLMPFPETDQDERDEGAGYED